MKTARLTVDPAFRVGPVRRHTFGSFVEHLGRCVYTGIHNPGRPTADADGFRRYVIDLTRKLGVSTVRYPGGNFVSGYRWEDGIGPIMTEPGGRVWKQTIFHPFAQASNLASGEVLRVAIESPSHETAKWGDVTDGALTAVVPPVSWSVFRLGR